MTNSCRLVTILHLTRLHIWTRVPPNQRLLVNENVGRVVVPGTKSKARCKVCMKVNTSREFCQAAPLHADSCMRESKPPTEGQLKVPKILEDVLVQLVFHHLLEQVVPFASFL